MPISLLGTTSYISFLDNVTNGGIEATHVARIKPSQAAPTIRAYVKFYAPTGDGGAANRGLLNELIGFHFAEACGLPVPSDAGLIVVRTSQLASPPPWAASGGHIVGWWAKDMVFPSLKAVFAPNGLALNSAAAKKLQADVAAALQKRSNVAAIAAFDDLIANIDRNLGNVLDGNGLLLLIDHGQSLTGRDWVAADLDASKTFANKIIDMYLPNGMSGAFKSALLGERQRFSPLISSSISDIEELLSKMLPAASDVAAVKTFLTGRCGNNASYAQNLGLVI